MLPPLLGEVNGDEKGGEEIEEEWANRQQGRVVILVVGEE
jgi:hypothetical protein